MNMTLTTTRVSLGLALAIASIAYVSPSAAQEMKTLSLESFGENQSDAPIHYAWMGDFKQNSRFAIDLSTRVIYNETAEVTAYANFIGVDFYKILTGPNRDWGTLTLQPYLTRIDNMGSHPPFFESGNDWELVPRIFNLNYTGLSRGEFNIKVGHMEVPFGLEHIVNTNGTLRDYIHGPNIGVKPDWGFSLNGELPAFDYEIALLRGSGIEYSSTGDPYLLAGRIGTSQQGTPSFGLSFFHGKVQNLSLADQTLTRSRIGLDMIWRGGPITMLTEISAGDDEGTDVINTLFELDWNNPDETLMVFWQLQNFSKNFPTGWDDATMSNLGVRYAPDSHWAYSAMWKRGLRAFADGPNTNVFMFQLRYRH